MFFFEKKNQKTFVRSCTCAAGVPGRAEGEGVKVFWFFFSKKNIFLPYPGATGRSCSSSSGMP